MRSVSIKISRPGDADNTNLDPRIEYVFSCENLPEITFSIDCKQNDVYKNFTGLRYDQNLAASAAPNAISFFEKLIDGIFTKLQYLDKYSQDSPLHIRLITTPMELAQLPFEFLPVPSLWNHPAGDPPTSVNANKYLLIDTGRKVTLTREVLLESEAKYNWPKQPRILFAWAQPNCIEENDTYSVPHKEHLKALVNVVTPLARPKKGFPVPEPDTDGFLTELANASLKSIQATIKKAIEDEKPYSHIHILAHGGNITDAINETVFVLNLCGDYDSKEEKKANGEKLVAAIIPAGQKGTNPVVVTLSACDSANTGNLLIPSGSLIGQLHQAGIPCLFASQFPLTKEGSNTLVTTLYSNLINAEDPREALYQARIALYKNDTHDWASLVAFARFPENIDEQLQKIRLDMLFRSMKTTTAWVDHLLKYSDKIPKNEKELLFIQIIGRLEKSIQELSGYLTPENKSILETDKLKSEHLGLLGSAYKRKAEFLYLLIQFNTEEKVNYVLQSTEALKIARDFYKGGYDANRLNHWVAMQHLSLKAILGESLEPNVKTWFSILTKAEEDEENAKAAADELAKKREKNSNLLWAWGTLAELYLLESLTVGNNDVANTITTATEKAKNYMKQMAAIGNNNGANLGIYNEEKESTVRQLERYIYWWPEMFSDTNVQKLKDMAITIRAALPQLEELI